MNTLPLVYSEVLGRYVTVPDEPRRIVSFSPAITETVFMLGMGDAIAAVSAFCVRPEEARRKRRIGSYNTVRDELLDEINPDLVFTVTGYQRDFALRLSKKYCVYPLELPVSISGIVDTVTKVGLVLGKERESRKLARELLKKIALTETTTKRLRVYVEIDFGEPVSFGAYSYITDAIELLGCENVYGSSKCEWLKPDLKHLSRAEPDVFIYEPKMFSSFSYEDLLTLIEKRGLSSLSFVRKKNFFLTPGPYDFLAHHGPSFILEAVPWLSRVLKEAESKL